MTSSWWRYQFTTNFLIKFCWALQLTYKIWYSYDLQIGSLKRMNVLGVGQISFLKPALCKWVRNSANFCNANINFSILTSNFKWLKFNSCPTCCTSLAVSTNDVTKMTRNEMLEKAITKVSVIIWQTSFHTLLIYKWTVIDVRPVGWSRPVGQLVERQRIRLGMGGPRFKSYAVKSDTVLPMARRCCHIS